MALMKCKECGSQVSTQAKACPQCGARPPKKPIGLVGGLVLLVVVVMLYNNVVGEPSPPSTAVAKTYAAPVPTKKSEAELRADREMNVAIGAARAIKASMKNPDSFRLEGFLIYAGGATCFDYRGTNSFNAVVPGRAVFAEGKLLTQDRDGNQMVSLWNKVCTKPGGRDLTRGVAALAGL